MSAISALPPAYSPAGGVQALRAFDRGVPFYLPGEWCDIIEKAGFGVRVVTGAWMAPPLLRRIGLFNRLFGLAGARLGDGALSKIGQTLIVEAAER